MKPNAHFRRLADQLAASIRDGSPATGERLLPLREYAYRNGIAFSTASKVYSELVRRGLVAGEVGRDTYVLGPAAPVDLHEPHRPKLIDLEFNSTSVGAQDLAILHAAMATVSSGSLTQVATTSLSSASPLLRTDLLASHLSRDDWRLTPSDILASSSGRSAIAACFAAFAEPGSSIGLETLTFPMAKAIARHLGLRTIPLEMDAEGALPDAMEKAHRDYGTRLFYLQPTLHNPSTVTMGHGRREDVARLLVRHGLTVVEDAVYGFLAPDSPPPIASLAPENVIVIDSFSKRGFSGVPVGFASVRSPVLARRVTQTLRSGAWLPSPMNLALVSALLESRSLATIEARKRQSAKARQSVLRAHLRDWDVQADRRCFHAWLKLPARWRSQAYADALLAKGVAVTPGAGFAVQPGHAPDAVRLAFSAIAPETLANALLVVSGALRSAPDDRTLT